MTKEQTQPLAKKRGVAVEPIAEPKVEIVGWTVEEAAAALRVSPRAVQDALAAGKLPGRLIGGKWRLSPRGLDAFLGSFEHERREGGPEETAAPVADAGNTVPAGKRIGMAAPLGRK